MQYNALTETNFTEGCTSSGSGARYCTCAYGVFSGPNGLPFSEFAKLDGQLANNPDAMPDDIKAKLQTCGTPGGPTTLAPASTGTPAPRHPGTWMITAVAFLVRVAPGVAGIRA
jgi:hypothetical protein